MLPETKRSAGARIWRYRLLLGATALLAGAAVVMAGVALWSAPRQAADAEQATATVGSSPYSDAEVAAAKNDACDAATRTDAPMTEVARRLWDTPKGSSEEPAAMAAYQRVTLVEIEYLKSRTREEAPEGVRAAVAAYTAALLAEVDAVTRGLPVSEKTAATKAAGVQLDNACKEG